jgi:hypothetical protein
MGETGNMGWLWRVNMCLALPSCVAAGFPFLVIAHAIEGSLAGSPIVVFLVCEDFAVLWFAAKLEEVVSEGHKAT